MEHPEKPINPERVAHRGCGAGLYNPYRVE
jgi:hypothetical protein